MLSHKTEQADTDTSVLTSQPALRWLLGDLSTNFVKALITLLLFFDSSATKGINLEKCGDI